MAGEVPPVNPAQRPCQHDPSQDIPTCSVSPRGALSMGAAPIGIGEGSLDSAPRAPPLSPGSPRSVNQSARVQPIGTSCSCRSKGWYRRHSPARRLIFCVGADTFCPACLAHRLRLARPSPRSSPAAGDNVRAGSAAPELQLPALPASPTSSQTPDATPGPSPSSSYPP